MRELIEVFEMTQVPHHARVNVLKKLGEAINYKYGSNVTDELVDELIQLLDRKYKPQRKSDQKRANLIVRAVSDITGVEQSKMKSRTRRREYTDARHIAIYIIRERTELSLSAIARMFNRDHSTTVTATKKVSNLLDSDPKFKERYLSCLETADKFIS